MTADVNARLATIAGDATALKKRDGSFFQVAGSHAIKWATCAGVLSCLSGKGCTLDIKYDKAPRSLCQSQGDSNYCICISWSDYSVNAGFFDTAWIECDNEIQSQGMSKVSYQGEGSSFEGGDVCLSDRSTGCT